LEQLEAEIPQLEAEKSALEAQLSAGTLSHEELSSAATRIGEIINTLEEKEMRWLELSEI
jgi:ATP-binding cassette subfamily F protein uup